MLPCSVFFHIPKTGGTWVREAIAYAGVPTVELGNFPNPASNVHNAYPHVDTQGKFTFTFVRHPVTWYASFWAYRMETGWRSEDILDSFQSDDFEKFMWGIVGRLPGHLSKRYEHYTGPPPGRLNFVGRQENLYADLVRALKLAGDKFNERKLKTFPPLKMTRLKPRYPQRLLQAVLDSEKEAIRRYGYEGYPLALDLGSSG